MGLGLGLWLGSKPVSTAATGTTPGSTRPPAEAGDRGLGLGFLLRS